MAGPGPSSERRRPHVADLRISRAEMPGPVSESACEAGLRVSPKGFESKRQRTLTRTSPRSPGPGPGCAFAPSQKAPVSESTGGHWHGLANLESRLGLGDPATRASTGPRHGPPESALLLQAREPETLWRPELRRACAAAGGRRLRLHNCL